MPTSLPAPRPVHATLTGTLRHGSVAREATDLTDRTGDANELGVIQHTPGIPQGSSELSARPSMVGVTAGRRPGVHDYARRMAFLTELDSQTWMSRYSASERLGDPDAVLSVSSYAAWLRRTGAAWTHTPMPTSAQAASVWQFTSVPATALDALIQIDHDERDLARAHGGPGRDHVARPVPLSRSVETQNVDAAYAAAALYVAVAAAQEVAVLAADVEHLSASQARTTLPQRYIKHSLHVAAARNLIRRELAEWASTAGPQACERVVLAARMLVDELSASLVTPHRPGW